MALKSRAPRSPPSATHRPHACAAAGKVHKGPYFISLLFLSLCFWAVGGRLGRLALRLHSLLPRALRPGRAPTFSTLIASASGVALHFTPAIVLFEKKTHVASCPYVIAHHRMSTPAPLRPPAATLQPSPAPSPSPQRPASPQ